MRFPPRRSDDADVIRARLRLLLAERDRAGGWVPEDLEEEGRPFVPSPPDAGWPGDDTVTAPLTSDADTGVGLPAGIGRHRAPGTEARWDPGRPGARSLWIAALVAAFVLAGWTWLDRPRVEPVEGAQVRSSAPATPPVGEVAETSEMVVVSVVGPVATPGLVTLPAGSRVADAVAAAGGLLPGADPASVNLAAVVSDGEQLTVGLPGGAGPAAAPAGAATDAATGGRVDLNTADVPELDALPGIGPVLAQRIVEHRTRQGPFRSVEQLDDVPGIGPAIAAELAELVTV
ncbi:competence protein ComEA [Blastococcus colisei]|uniref:Competence protein ComEA n=1 Tax=Blastococcus colisei TaxID=1564162 RepID=A0A543PII3_9ACTN|nr:ComEA family DNA-binding protein [Blastococcus colisei]TQN43890.1 competence protein ComEA [Blastococcus colisei]